MRRIVVALVAALLMTSLVACGSKASLPTTSDTTTAQIDAANPAMSAAPADCPSKNTETLAKTRAVFDAGLIYASAKHWIIEPYKTDHIGGVVAKGKALAAAAAIYFLAKALLRHVNASPLLCKTLGAPVRAIVAATSKLSHLSGLSDLSSLTSLGGAITALPGLGAVTNGSFDLKSLASAATGL